MSVLLEFHLQLLPLIYQTIATLVLRLDLFLQSLKLLSSLLFLLIKHMHLFPLLSLPSYSSDHENVSPPPVTKLSISSYKNSDRAASVPRSILPSNTMDSSANSLNSSYVVRTKPLSFKITKSLVLKSLAPFRSSVYIKSSVSGTVSDPTNTSQS